MNRNENGSALVLVLIAALILSLIGIAGLENTSLETGTNRQFMADKTALHAAETGISTGVIQIYNTLKPYEVTFTQNFAGMNLRSGTLDTPTPQPVQAYTSFKAPPPVGTSIELASEINATVLLWQLNVAAEGDPSAVNKNIRTARKELANIVAAFAPGY